LRFTLAEANAFLNQGMRLALEPEAVALLAARTEGWIAALQLAALALQPPARSGRADVAQFIQGCAGQDCFILDYLAAQTLARQPERVRAFLLQTSILKQLCGPLCEAVMGEPGGQALLELLDRLSMFLMPLDEERRWFRYHPLFADLLCAQLDATWPEQVPLLQGRAAEWYAAQGFAREAARHAALAG
jgi:LuxR family maltose regulon positive regulatory protein